VLGSDREKKSAAELMKSGYPAYQAVEWVDPTLGVRWAAAGIADDGDLGVNLSADACSKARFKSPSRTGT
jgi:hypothetical protein